MKFLKLLLNTFLTVIAIIVVIGVVCLSYYLDHLRFYR